MFNFFDKLEDRVRVKLSRFPIVYGIIAGTFIVLFWRGVWHTADILENLGGVWAIVFSGPGMYFFSLFILLMSGLLVSSFIGNHIIISGIKKEKKVIDKTETELASDSDKLVEIESKLQDMNKVLGEIKDKL